MPKTKKQILIESILNFLKGIAVGVSVIVPGFSSGTVLILCSIYEPLLDKTVGLIKSKKQFLEGLIFLLPIALGAIVGIFAFAQALGFLLDRFSLPIFSLFAGLILGSVPMIILVIYNIKKRKTNNSTIEVNQAINIKPVRYSTKFTLTLTLNKAVLLIDREEVKKDSFIKVDKFKIWHIIPMLFAAAIVIALAWLQRIISSPDASVDLTASIGLIIAISGVLSGMALITPGISGALMLILLGQYRTILDAISFSNFNIAIVAIFALGAIVGLVGSVIVIRLLLKKFRFISHLAITGFLIGSVAAIFMLEDTFYSATGVAGVIVAILLFIVGCAVSFLLPKIKTLKKPDIK